MPVPHATVHVLLMLRIGQKGPFTTGRFRGQDHLHGPQQGPDRLELIESFAGDPGFDRIGRVVCKLLRHTCSQKKRPKTGRFCGQILAAFLDVREPSHTSFEPIGITSTPIRTIPFSSVAAHHCCICCISSLIARLSQSVQSPSEYVFFTYCTYTSFSTVIFYRAIAAIARTAHKTTLPLRTSIICSKWQDGAVPPCNSFQNGLGRSSGSGSGRCSSVLSLPWAAL